jgi:beta-N-acetylhexosaminidase
VTVAATLAAFVALPVVLLATDRPTVAAAAAATAPPSPPPVANVVAPAGSPAPLETRAGAVLVVGLPGVKSPDEETALAVTSVGVSGVFLGASNVRSADQIRELVTGLRARSPRPIRVMTDAESGRVSVLRAVIGGGPSPRRLARRDTPEQVQSDAADLGGRLKDLGIALDLAPVLDRADGPSAGIIGDRSFGTDPETVTTYATAFVAGLADAGVDSAVKHFPGQGRSGADTHIRKAVVDTSVDELRGRVQVPFHRLINTGTPVVVMKPLDYTELDGDVPASLSPAAYALLRSMGFEGVAITDSLGMGAVNTRWDFPVAAVRAITAGADAAFATDGRQAVRMRDALVAAVRNRTLPEERLNEAATRMARLAGADVHALTCSN